MKNSKPFERLKYHVSGAIERGEKEPITAITECPNCDDGTVSISIPCPECKNENSVRMYDAAPEMLHCLKLIKEQLSQKEVTFIDIEYALKQAKYAIAKAEGREE